MTGKDELLLDYAARRAATREGYMAHLLATYERQENLTPDDLPAWLGITGQDYSRLALCRAPDPQACDFWERIERIASYAGVPATKLTQIVGRASEMQTATVDCRHQVQKTPVDRNKEQASTSILRRLRGWLVAPRRRRARVALLLAPTASMLVCVLACATIVCTTMLWPDGSVVQQPTTIQVEGTVQVLPAEDGEWQAAAPDGRMKAGDRVHTEAFSTATLTFFDGSVAQLESGTNVLVIQTSQPEQADGRIIMLQQDIGTIHYSVEPIPGSNSRFEIQTPSATVIVRGTEFTVEVSTDGTTAVKVYEGTVEVTDQGKVFELQDGMDIQVPPVEPSKPAEEATPVPTTTHIPSKGSDAEPTETAEPDRATATPEPTEPTRTPKPSHTPKPSKTPKPKHTPKPTHRPKPTKKPKPSKEKPRQGKSLNDSPSQNKP